MLKPTSVPTTASSRAERWLTAIFFLLLLALHIRYAFVYRVDSDEPQHLHVVWGWTQELLQYRDFFDNHTPLFQMLCAPLLAAFGERSDIIPLMRLAMIPLTFITLWCIYKIGAALFSKRAGIWAALLAGFFPFFFLISTEFRTDQLWTTLWFASLATLICGRMRPLRAFCFGLLFGATFCASMKTSLLAVSLAVAALLSLFFMRKNGGAIPWRSLPGLSGAFLAGLVILPAFLTGYFAAESALNEFYYCIFVHNALPGLGHWHKPGVRHFYFPVALPFIIVGTMLLIRHAPTRSLGVRRALLFAVACIYCVALYGYWPLLTAEDDLPYQPLGALFLAPVAIMVSERLAAHSRISSPALSLTVISIAEIAVLLALANPLKNEALSFQKRLASTLALTNPGDYVMDGKGETIFRKRPFYFVLEGVTIARIRQGSIKDTITSDLIRTRTCVVIDNRLRSIDQRFLAENYLPVAYRLCVAGKELNDDFANGESSHEKSDDLARKHAVFTTVIAADYVIINAENQNVNGTLDGRPFAGNAFLAAGPHTFSWSGAEPRLHLFWSQAWKRGFRPIASYTIGQKKRKPQLRVAF